MKEFVTTATLFALYQATLVVGILLLPLAVLARRLGVSVPLGHLVDRLGEAYEAHQ